MDSQFCESSEADGTVYARHYRHVDTVFFPCIRDLLAAIKTGYDIIHLFVSLSAGGLLVDTESTSILGSELIQKCCEQDVKLLWIASENKPEEYVKGFRVAGRSLNLIMTIARNGTTFASFLEKLLLKVSDGERLPSAWAALAPQAEGPWQQETPSCIFFAGRADVKLLSGRQTR